MYEGKMSREEYEKLMPFVRKAQRDMGVVEAGDEDIEWDDALLRKQLEVLDVGSGDSECLCGGGNHECLCGK